MVTKDNDNIIIMVEKRNYYMVIVKKDNDDLIVMVKKVNSNIITMVKSKMPVYLLWF